MADTRDLKSLGLKSCAGSSPAIGTNLISSLTISSGGITISMVVTHDFNEELKLVGVDI